MTTPLAPRGNLAVNASAAVMRMPFGRALQRGHADAFGASAADVPTDSAVDVSVGACTGATLRREDACAGRLASLARR
jgi:hypothetical protein